MVRSLALSAVIVALVAVTAGCSRKDPTIQQLDGSEPQRISFGDPKTVHTHFSEKMTSCWFGGQQPLLQGYRYVAETIPPPAESNPNSLPASSIRIIPENPADAQHGGAFQVEFHPYNSNTLISTRNLGLPMELAARLKRDVETWIFGRKECSDRDLQPALETSPAPPQGLSQPPRGI
jgi:hypothetical protein